MSHGSKAQELQELHRLAMTMRGYAVESGDLHYARMFFEAATDLEGRAAAIAITEISALPRLLPYRKPH
jgi:hypothetical protein